MAKATLPPIGCVELVESTWSRCGRQAKWWVQTRDRISEPEYPHAMCGMHARLRARKWPLLSANSEMDLVDETERVAAEA